MEENTLLQPEQNSTLTIERSAMGYLMETARWGKFMAIFGFIGLGLLVVMALFYGTAMGTIMGPEVESLPASFSIIIAVVYILFAALFLFPVLYLFRFSSQIQSSIRSKNSMEFTEALSNLKSLFKFMGIYAIVILALYGIIIVGALLGAAIMG